MKHSVQTMVVVGTLSLATILALWLNEPPSPQGLNAPSNTFSAARAKTILMQWENHGAMVPHPPGSQAHRRLRAAIVKTLQSQELEILPSQAQWKCAGSRCVWVHNIVARLKANAPKVGKAVALSVHYDSVGAGPGINDDLASVAAVIETLRILKSHPKRTRDVIALIADGEEMGLLGARAFYTDRSHIQAQVGTVINMEARGSGGPSYLFETSAANRWAVEHILTKLQYPHTSSLHQTIYEALPNGTDFSVHKRRGKHGVGMGYIRNLPHYHSPLDNLENLNMKTLQHQGQQGLEATLAMFEAPEPPKARNKKVYTDYVGQILLHWSAEFGMMLWGLGWICFVIAWWRQQRKLEQPMRKRHWILGPIWVLGMFGLSAMVLGVLSTIAIALKVHPAPWWAYHWPWVVVGVVWAVWLMGAWMTRRQTRVTPRERWFGWLSYFGVVAGILCWVLPAISFLWLLPWLVLSVVTAVGVCGQTSQWHTREIWCLSLGVALTSTVWVPLLSGLLDGVGVMYGVPMALVGVSIGAGVLILLPTWSSRTIKVGIGVAIASAVGLMAVPTESEHAPMGLNIVAHQHVGQSHAQYGLLAMPVDLFFKRPKLPDGFEKTPLKRPWRVKMPWASFMDVGFGLESRGASFKRPSAKLQPRLVMGRHTQTHGKGAHSGHYVLTFPKDAVAIMVNSSEKIWFLVDDYRTSTRFVADRANQRTFFRPTSDTVKVRFKHFKPMDLTITTIYSGLPSTKQSDQWTRTRRNHHAAPAHFGDMTMVTQTYRLKEGVLTTVGAPAAPR